MEIRGDGVVLQQRLLDNTPAERVVLLLLWALPGVLAMLVEQSGMYPLQQHGVITSLLVLALSAFGFLRFGGDWILPSSVFHLGCGIFVGFAGLAQVTGGIAAQEPQVGLALSILYLAQCATLVLPARPVRKTTQWPAAQAPQHVFLLGVVSVVVGLLAMNSSGRAAQIVGPLATFFPSVAFVGLVLIAVNNFLISRRAIAIGLAGVGVFVAAYFLYGFDGFGRMILGTIGIAVAAVLALRYGRPVKVLGLLGVPMTLVFLAGYRAAVSRTINARSQENGFESVVSAVGVYIRFFGAALDGALPLHWGSSYVSAALVLVPRTMWEGKPDLLGKEVVAFVAPDLADTTHSVAAMLFGEWLWNFGLLGLVFTILVWVALLGLFDRISVSWMSSSVDGWAGVLRITAAATLAASMVDLIWGGSSAWATRDMLRLILIGVMALLLVLLPRLIGTDRDAHHRSAYPSEGHRDRPAPNPRTVAHDTVTLR